MNHCRGFATGALDDLRVAFPWFVPTCARGWRRAWRRAWLRAPVHRVRAADLLGSDLRALPPAARSGPAVVDAALAGSRPTAARCCSRRSTPSTSRSSRCRARRKPRPRRSLRLARRPRRLPARLRDRARPLRRARSARVPRRVGRRCSASDTARCDPAATRDASARSSRTGPTTAPPTGTAPSRARDVTETLVDDRRGAAGAAHPDRAPSSSTRGSTRTRSCARSTRPRASVPPTGLLTLGARGPTCCPRASRALRRALGDPPLVLALPPLRRAARPTSTTTTPGVDGDRAHPPTASLYERLARTRPQLGRRDLRARLARRVLPRRARPARGAGPRARLAGGRRPRGRGAAA